MPAQTSLIAPYGGRLVSLLAEGDAAVALRAEASRLPSLVISDRAACDLELLATGGFSPLDRFMGRRDHERCLAEMRLAGGALFPIPVALPVEREAAPRLDSRVALRDARNEILAVLTVEEIYEWDRAATAQGAFGTLDTRHPLVAEMQRWGPLNVSGRLEVLALPAHYDFKELRLTPAQTRARLAALGRANVVAFQTRNPLHRVHEELTKRATEKVDGVHTRTTTLVGDGTASIRVVSRDVSADAYLVELWVDAAKR